MLRVEPSHSVAALTAAVARFLGAPGDPAGLHLIRASTGETLPPPCTLAEVGLVSGEALVIRRVLTPVGPGPGPGSEPTPEAAGLELVVASGPDAGQRRVLTGPGGRVGRDRSNWLPLSDPRVGRVHLDAAVGTGTSTGTGASGSAPVAIMVTPAGEARGPTLVDGEPIGGPTPLAAGQIVGLGGTTLRIQPVPAPSAAAPAVGEIPFHRTPYFPTPVEEQVFPALGDIPERGEPPRFAYLAALAPLVMGVTMALIYSPRFLIFAGFSPLVAVAGWLDQRRRQAQRYGRGAERFRARAAERRLAVEAARRLERQRRFRNAPDLVALADQARTRSAELWIRDRASADFLELRVGLGDQRSAVRVEPETRGDETLRDELADELGSGAVLHQVPISLGLAGLPVVALVGAEADTTALVASLLAQAACLHSPEDLVLAAAVAPERALGWLAWLPHTRSSSSPLDGPHLAVPSAAPQVAAPTGDGPDGDGPDGEGPGGEGPAPTGDGPVGRLLRRLLVVAEARAANPDRAVDHRWPWLLVVIDRRAEPDPATVSRLADLAPHAGLSLIWLTGSADRVPRQAVATVTCEPAPGDRPSRLAFVDPNQPDRELEIERAPAALAGELARHLAPLRDASSPTATSALPRLVTLHQAFGVADITPAWVIARWRRSRGHHLPTPVGLAAGGPVVVDLVEHGPHGLIGGTSGAGKSELLMSLVAGLVAHNPPSRLNLLFVDYKGGASSDRFRPLPHTVGYVTNLDALLAQRALVSLRAELTRRMSLLQGRAKDLAEMIDRHPDEAPPALVLVVDEFATLVKEVPEFVAGVVDVAQRGRSLGIHLLLATQRPSGAVNENILANTNLRISLRMLDSAESTSVIGTNDAATIPTPLKGRAYARLGPGELVAFQSAWSGAPLRPAGGPPPVEVVPLVPASPTSPPGSPPGHAGPGPAGSGPAGSGPGGEAPTQLDGLLAAVAGAAERLGLPPGRSPWLKELPAVIPLAEVTGPPTGGGAGPGWPVALGMVDDPAAQAQYPALVDLEAGGGLLVLGTGGSGRTATLRTLAAAAGHSAAARGRPLSLVVLDFASRELLALAAQPACAVAAAGDDLEAVTRAIALLDRMVTRRRAERARAASDGRPAPTFDPVLVLIDDYGNLAQTFEGSGAATALFPWLETVNRVIVDGRQVGVHTALTATRRAVVKAGVLAAVTNRLVLRQAEPAGYTEAGLPASQVAGAELPPGRGFLNGPDLIQVAWLAPAEAPPPAQATQADTARAAVAPVEATPAAGPDPALAIGPLPADAGPPPTAGPDPDQGRGSWAVVIGPVDLEPGPAVLDLTHDHLVVHGEPRTGRSTALATVGRQLAAAGVELWVVGPSSSPLSALVGLGALDPARLALGRAGDVRPLLAELAEPTELAGRVGPAGPADQGGPARVLLVDDWDLLEDPQLDPPVAAILAAGVRLVASTTSLRGYSTSPLTQELKKARSLLHLQPAGSREVQELTGVNPRLRPGVPLGPGRGVLVAARTAHLVQVFNGLSPRPDQSWPGYSMPWSRA